MPLVLNNSLYGHEDGINYKDSCGHFAALGEFSTAQKISRILLLTAISTDYSSLVGGYGTSTSDDKHTAGKLDLLTLIGMMGQSGKNCMDYLVKVLKMKFEKRIHFRCIELLRMVRCLIYGSVCIFVAGRRYGSMRPKRTVESLITIY
jgi:hypothetical protein